MEMHIDSLRGHHFEFCYSCPHQAYLLVPFLKFTQSEVRNRTNEKPEFENVPKLSHLTFHSISSRETISIKNIKIMNPMKVCQIDADWLANERASLDNQFVNPPKAIAQSSILGG